MTPSLNLRSKGVCRACYCVWDTALEVDDRDYWRRASTIFHAFRLAADHDDAEAFLVWLFESAQAMARMREEAGL